MVVRGGMHIDGELSVNHITAPTEFQETEITKLYGKPVGAPRIGTAVVDSGSSAGSWPVYGTSADENSLIMYDHSHHFRNIPLTLTETNSQVREIAKANNETEINAATEVNNRKKTFNENDPRS